MPLLFLIYPADNYLFKGNNKNSSRTRCEICSKLTIKTPEDANDVVLVSLLLTSMIISHLLLAFGHVITIWVT